jgi:hypothetical protein
MKEGILISLAHTELRELKNTRYARVEKIESARQPTSSRLLVT